MKVMLSAITLATMDDFQLKLEAQWWDFKDIAPLCDKIEAVEAAGGAGTYNMYIDLQMEIQGAQTGAAAAITMTVIDKKYKPIFSNLIANSIGQFQGGREYLILNTDAAPTLIIPVCCKWVAAVQLGTDSPVFCSRRYWYRCAESHNPYNSASVNVITYDRNYVAESANDNVWDLSKKQENQMLISNVKV